MIIGEGAWRIREETEVEAMEGAKRIGVAARKTGEGAEAEARVRRSTREGAEVEAKAGVRIATVGARRIKEGAEVETREGARIGRVRGRTTREGAEAEAAVGARKRRTALIGYKAPATLGKSVQEEHINLRRRG